MYSKIKTLMIISALILFLGTMLLHGATKITATTNQTKTIIATSEQTERLALKGDAEAQNQMGKYYFFKRGDGATEFENMVKAERWFRLAAAQDHAESMFGLACILDRRAETVEDEIKIARLFEGAAHKGNKAAQYSLAMYILGGKANLIRDTKVAADLLKKSAAQNNANAHFALVQMAQQKECDIRTGDRSRQWLTKKAEKGDTNSQVNIGLINEYGYTIPKNFSKAMIWYKKAALNGSTDALFKIGKFYESGTGVKIDYRKAIGFYEKAIDKGEFRANWHIGQLYEKGQGVLQNDEKAVNYYLTAAKHGYPKSMTSLGIMLLEGRGVEQNDDLAAQWIGQAAAWGNAEAQFRFGKMYKKGLIDVALEKGDKIKTWFRLFRGVFIDPGIKARDREANKWLRKAAAQGHEGAIKILETDKSIMGWVFLCLGPFILLFSIGLFAWPEVMGMYNPIIVRYISAPLLCLMGMFLIIEGFRTIFM